MHANSLPFSIFFGDTPLSPPCATLPFPPLCGCLICESFPSVGEGELSIYRVGNGSRCIVWNYDSFGFDGGRTREVADLIASKGIARRLKL